MNEIEKRSLLEVLKNYDFCGKVIEVIPVENGNINHTFTVICDDGEKYLVQKINTNAFKEPFILMKNIENITNHIERFYKRIKDQEHQCLKVIRTTNDEPLTITQNELGEKSYYRVYNYIENSVSYNKTNDSNIIFNVGKAFGYFQRALTDYPIDDLDESIPNFHNTPKRFENFIKDIKIDPLGRAEKVAKEILFFIKREEAMSSIVKLIDSGKVPKRVTHNDTKVNNVMMNKITGDFMTVIDLDTVMPGSCLYDYGDAVRSACATAEENETDLSKIYLDEELFTAFTKGYLIETSKCLNLYEINNLGNSIRIITLELAMRFLNDYINGDTYFKTKYQDHNLDRARNQMKLVTEIETNMPNIEETIVRLIKEYK